MLQLVELARGVGLRLLSGEGVVVEVHAVIALSLEVESQGEALGQRAEVRWVRERETPAVVDAVEMDVGLRGGVGEAASESKDGQERLTPVGQAALQGHTRLTLGEIPRVSLGDGKIGDLGDCRRIAGCVVGGVQFAATRYSHRIGDT